MSVPAAHASSEGEGVTVAVLDTGIRTDHPALKGRAKEGPDFLQEDDQSESWYGDHGTSMASSVLDVAPEAKVLGLRVIRDPDDPDYQTPDEVTGQGGSRDNSHGLSQAITYATDHGADVISLSLGSGSVWDTYDEEQAKAIEYALSKGVVVLAALGNEGNVERGEENQVSYPAAYPGVISVAASVPGGSRAPFSSVHSYADIAAPGVVINAADYRSSGRKPVQGTSSACALAAGVSALIVSKYPDLPPRQVAQVLEGTASHASRGHSVETGYGVINAHAALRAAAKLTPEKPVAIGKAGAGVHFGPGDDGTPQMVTYGLDPEYFAIAAGGALTGLLAILGGLWLFRSGRRLQRLGPSDGGPGGSAGYPQYGQQPVPLQQNPYQQAVPPPRNPYQQQPTSPHGQWPPQQ
ncbi:S8 family serine peptidase [Streptomyces sp. PSKA54]|uniref:S8 family serine peptidase n=1 Tax=Streptomyces himalayensis subsp. aureolus TaxID=2758039 RepID=A0A7W2D480_9ACTN|nr:S8 family serine peptidase [Streptomyces himalayensis]MBA4864413.1 S8 family serine peptidase [Streptomyces himalayensis subsp. aureolus]